ncbi:MAG: 6-carboxytetrahydropterin synthase [Candidatus Kapaibacterium sp.]|jgi:6-pyruvoyltetrahydropterin/6-carboxytetrahydropterin synthase|nr:6-carboxytetrahydropterin synthase [Candidatus Kapabacteria bacterium]
MLYVTKKLEFSASHRLFNPTFTDNKNDEIFDKCNNFFGHGHNYFLEVTVAGLPNPETGYVIDLKKLKRIIKNEIIDKVDHKHLNHDVAFLKGIIPSAENLAVVFWKILKDKIDDGQLYKIRLYESESSYVEYMGAEVTIPIYDFGE